MVTMNLYKFSLKYYVCDVTVVDAVHLMFTYILLNFLDFVYVCVYM